MPLPEQAIDCDYAQFVFHRPILREVSESEWNAFVPEADILCFV
jgi:hypothetical protein